jgi:predicted transposase YbfD/YdcC
MHNLNIVSLFDGIKDKRRAHLRCHELTDVLFLCICATLCGADTYTQIASFGEERLYWLKQFGSFAHNIPSHDTIQRVLELLDPNELSALLRRWSQTMRELSENTQVAVDGKAVRGTWKKTGVAGLTLVSLWAVDQRLCLGIEAVGASGGEQQAANTILNLISIKGQIVTADAAFLNQTFCTQVLDKKGDYVISLKANQPKMYAEAEEIFASYSPKTTEKTTESVFSLNERTERNKGRQEYRGCVSTPCNAHLNTPFLQQLPGIRTLIRVQRRQDDKEPVFQYYASSLSVESFRFQEIIRKHWSVESQQHYVLDVALHEDRSSLRTGNGPKNMAILRRLALNLAQQHKPPKISLKSALFKAALSTGRLENLLLGPKSDA